MLLALLAFSFVTTYAQYPQLTPAAKARVDSMQKAWAKHQAEVWAKAEPIVKKEAAEGRPYVPWAGRPTDLPQAKIPAFPGAEGGGMYSFGGRGGKSRAYGGNNSKFLHCGGAYSIAAIPAPIMGASSTCGVIV